MRFTVPVVALGLAAVLLQPATARQERRASQQRQKEGPCLEFEELRMTLERNATDGDTEVVLFAKGQDAGLDRLVIIAPNGREVAAIKADRAGVGIREFHLESAEPPDLDAVLASFPEGTYTFGGRTVNGECITGSTFLSHEIAPATELLTPQEEDIIAIDQVTLSWKPVDAAERYVVELNNEDTGSEFTFQVFPPTTSIAIPANVLQAGNEYQFGVGVQTASGNITFVETTFFTAP